MQVYDNVLRVVGRTPLVRLNKIVPKNFATVYAKLEYLNPGGSIKDRMALHIVENAEKKGLLKQGGTIVENTSGNTGMGLALIAAVKGYKIIFTIPDKMSQEKINLLRAFGAKVVVTPTNVPPDSPESYYETAKRIARETPNSFYVNQYHNPDNIEAHYKTTGPEIWNDTDGKVKCVVAGMGTGGTISGIGRFLKEKNPEVKIIGVDPVGSVFYNYFKTGSLGEPHVYKVEGIGEDILCGALDFSVIDDIYQVSDRESFFYTRRLAKEEGLFVGGSSGSAVSVALKVARKMNVDDILVVILPDSGDRYLSKIYNDEWMRVNGFLEEEEKEATVKDLLTRKKMELICANANDKIRDVVVLFKKYDISQVPVLEDGKPLGIVSESQILRYIIGDSSRLEVKVGEIVNKRVVIVDLDTPISKVGEQFLAGDVVLVRKGEGREPDKLTGIITKIDIIDYYSRLKEEETI